MRPRDPAATQSTAADHAAWYLLVDFADEIVARPCPADDHPGTVEPVACQSPRRKHAEAAGCVPMNRPFAPTRRATKILRGPCFIVSRWQTLSTKSPGPPTFKCPLIATICHEPPILSRPCGSYHPKTLNNFDRMPARPRRISTPTQYEARTS